MHYVLRHRWISAANIMLPMVSATRRNRYPWMHGVLFWSMVRRLIHGTSYTLGLKTADGQCVWTLLWNRVRCWSGCASVGVYHSWHKGRFFPVATKKQVSELLKLGNFTVSFRSEEDVTFPNKIWSVAWKTNRILSVWHPGEIPSGVIAFWTNSWSCKEVGMIMWT